jgi:hypothetical protein
MTDDELVSRLRYCAEHPRMTYPEAVATVLDGAARIETLAAEKARLEGALREIASLTTREYVLGRHQANVVVGEVQEIALAALAPSGISEGEG